MKDFGVVKLLNNPSPKSNNPKKGLLRLALDFGILGVVDFWKKSHPLFFQFHSLLYVSRGASPQSAALHGFTTEYLNTGLVRACPHVSQLVFCCFGSFSFLLVVLQEGHVS